MKKITSTKHFFAIFFLSMSALFGLFFLLMALDISSHYQVIYRGGHSLIGFSIFFSATTVTGAYLLNSARNPTDKN
ncbi:hypothetical protein QEG73_14895 [Chitinophagaceae bacterium 26-R-25]|nr:hypothetical protein [Chitinophagaceae bacterium 26-R-25]